MTGIAFCIARHFAQLRAASESRVLTQLEAERMEVLARCVERYEAQEAANDALDRQAAEWLEGRDAR